jgi:hypothetical protein
MITLQDALIKILTNAKIESGCVACESTYSQNESIEEMSLDTLVSFTSFFVEAYILDQQKQNSERAMELLRKYCEECDYYCIVPQRYSEAAKRAMEVGFSREDKIFFLHEKALLDTTHIQWDSREWVMGLLRHLYILAVELHNFMKMEKKITHCPKEVGDVPPIKCLKIDACGMKRNMFVNRNGPTMTLGEFAGKLVAQGTQATQTTKKATKDGEDTLEALRKRDEFRDDLHFRKGNTQGKG